MTEPLAEKHAGHAADEREQHAFGEQRTDQSSARATQSRADGHLALADGSSDEKDIGDVTAGQQEYQAGKAKKQTGGCQEGSGGRRSGACAPLRVDFDLKILFCFGKSLGKAMRHQTQSRAGLLNAYPRLEATNHAKIARSRTGQQLRAVIESRFHGVRKKRSRI